MAVTDNAHSCALNLKEQISTHHSLPKIFLSMQQLTQALLDLDSGDHQGKDCTLLATTSCTRPAAERRRATASWWESPTSDCPLIMRSSSPAVSLPSLQKQSRITQLQGGPSPVPDSSDTWWDMEAWTTRDLSDAKLASGSERHPQEIIFITRTISPFLQGWDPSGLLDAHGRWSGSSSETHLLPVQERSQGWQCTPWAVQPTDPQLIFLKMDLGKNPQKPSGSLVYAPSLGMCLICL